MKILVTGAAGFIGSHFCQRLLDKEGYSILGIDNLNDYYSIKIKRFNLDILRNEILSPRHNFQFIKVDILDKEKLEKVFRKFKPDVVFHAAAMAGIRASLENPVLYLRVNIGGTTNLLELCRQYRIKNTIILSSSSVYGEKNGKILREEDLDLLPLSPYCVSKMVMEKMAYTYHYLYHLNITVIRPFSIYGPAGRVDMMPMKVILAAQSGKTIEQYGDNLNNQRDWTYIDDFIDGCLKALEKPLGFEIINLGHNEPLGIETFLKTTQEIIKKNLGKNFKIKKIPRLKEEMSFTSADLTKAGKLLGYKPKVDFATGFKRTVDFFKEHKEIYRDYFI